MPTTTYRSKEDCPKPPDHIVAGMDTAVLERLSKIMGYLRMGSAQGKAGKKLKKKEKAALLLQADAARQQLKSPPGSSLKTNGAESVCVCVLFGVLREKRVYVLGWLVCELPSPP